MAEQEQEEERLQRDFHKQLRDLKAVLESQRIKKQALKMKEAPAAQNAVSLNSKEYTNHDSDGPNKQIRTALGKATTPAPSLIDDNEASNTRSADEGKGLPSTVRFTPVPNVTESQKIEEEDDDDAPELFMPPPEQAAAEQELMRQHQAVINRMRQDFEEKLKGRVAIKRPQSASTTRPGGLSAALIEQIDRLQIQHETDLAVLSAMTKITTQQEIAQVTATLRSKRQEKLTRLAQLKAQKAVTAATSPVDPQSVIALLQEQTTSV